MMQNGKYTYKSSYQSFKEEAALGNVGDPPKLENELWKGIWALISKQGEEFDPEGL